MRARCTAPRCRPRHHDLRARTFSAVSDRRLFEDAQRVARLGTWAWNTSTGEVSGRRCCTSWVRRRHAAQLRALPRWSTRTTGPGWTTWRQLAENGEPVECEYRVVRPDGSVRVFRCHGASLGGRKTPVMVGTAQDVTEQRSTETRMQRSSQRFTDLVSITPVGIGLFDEGERLVDANDALCGLLGMDLEQLRGRTRPAPARRHTGEPRPVRSGPARAGDRGRRAGVLRAHVDRRCRRRPPVLARGVRRRHRAPAGRGTAAPPGHPRRADRSARPGRGQEVLAELLAGAGTRAASPCCSATSTTSSGSTTPLVTTPATSCWSRSPGG